MILVRAANGLARGRDRVVEIVFPRASLVAKTEPVAEIGQDASAVVMAAWTSGRVPASMAAM